MPQIVMDVSDDLLLALRESPEEFGMTARLAVAIHYLKAKRLSLGQAARLAGLTRLDFLDILTAHSSPTFDLSAADAMAEVTAARRTITHDRQ